MKEAEKKRFWKQKSGVQYESEFQLQGEECFSELAYQQWHIFFTHPNGRRAYGNWILFFFLLNPSSVSAIATPSHCYLTLIAM